MKKVYTLIVFVLNPLWIFTQINSNDLAIIKSVADNIIQKTTYTVTDTITHQTFEKLSKLPTDKYYTLSSEYMTWKYWNGVTDIGMVRLSDLTGDSKYKDYVDKHFRYLYDNLDFFKALYDNGFQNTGMDEYFRMHMLDDCGSMAAALIESGVYNQYPVARKYIDQVADYILNKETRLADGTLARSGPYDKTLWLDDLYMSIPFLARYAKLTGKTEYFDFAAKQIIQFTGYLYDKNLGLYYHCYFTPFKENGVAHWGRANGWCIMAQANLLEALPDNYPLKDTLIAIFRQQVNGLARYQSESGLWHQLLDKNDSYLETSCSAMFTCAIAKGVNNGWLDPNYKSIAQRGWEGLKSKIQPDGQVQDICVGTWIQNDLVFYYTRPKQLNDIHGLGAVIQAGGEVLKLK